MPLLYGALDKSVRWMPKVYVTIVVQIHINSLKGSTVRQTHMVQSQWPPNPQTHHWCSEHTSHHPRYCSILPTVLQKKAEQCPRCIWAILVTELLISLVIVTYCIALGNSYLTSAYSINITIWICIEIRDLPKSNSGFYRISISWVSKTGDDPESQDCGSWDFLVSTFDSSNAYDLLIVVPVKVIKCGTPWCTDLF